MFTYLKVTSPVELLNKIWSHPPVLTNTPSNSWRYRFKLKVLSFLEVPCHIVVTHGATPPPSLSVPSFVKTLRGLALKCGHPVYCKLLPLPPLRPKSIFTGFIFLRTHLGKMSVKSLEAGSEQFGAGNSRVLVGGGWSGREGGWNGKREDLG